VSHSQTTNFENYRYFDKECPTNKDALFQDFFPLSPCCYTNVKQANGEYRTVYRDDAHYLYRHFPAIDYTYDIYAEWPLDAEAFYQEVDRVTQLFQGNDTYDCITVQQGNYTCYVLYAAKGQVFEEVTDGFYIYYIFAYDESNLRVRYLYCGGFGDGSVQPYYLSLDW
jgi:hypothetical protein